jgi:hypothetical protein
MTNKYNATRVYWHPRSGYFKGKQTLDNYFNDSKIEVSGINKSDFQVFDSVFESQIHKLLIKWMDVYNKNLTDLNQLFLLSQIQIDLSQLNFCSMGYKIDFLIARRKRLGFEKRESKISKNQFKPFGMRYTDLCHFGIDTDNSLLIEAKGLFTAEARYKHLLLESNGWYHGRNIEIVQQEAQYVSRGTKCYKTLTPTQLENKLNLRFAKGE